MSMNNKQIISVGLVAVIIGTVVYLFSTQISKNKAAVYINTPVSITSSTADETGRLIAPSTTTEEQPIGKLKVANFSGTLEKVDTGCFADGECYVVVDGKHITVLMGWSQAVVGSVQGVESLGDLEQYAGKIPVEVYAQDKGDGTYTLYGSEGFYIRALFDY
jgi:hypothetical protein